MSQPSWATRIRRYATRGAKGKQPEAVGHSGVSLVHAGFQAVSAAGGRAAWVAGKRRWRSCDCWQRASIPLKPQAYVATKFWRWAIRWRCTCVASALTQACSVAGSSPANLSKKRRWRFERIDGVEEGTGRWRTFREPGPALVTFGAALHAW